MTSYDYLVEAPEERAEKRVTKRIIEEVTVRVTEEMTVRVTEEVEKAQVEVIKNARLKGSTIEFIADIVKLPEARVRSILDNLGIE